MKFEWDEAKAAANEAKHGIEFAFAERLLADPDLLTLDVSRPHDREVRYKAVGEFRSRLYVAIYTLRGPVMRLISVRRTNRGEEKNMPTVRYTPDPSNPYEMTAEQKARLDAMTDEELTANALSDPDNPPLTDDELDRMAAAYAVKVARQRTRLSQSAFAEAFHINLARLRDLEQGRTRPDSAMLAYLQVIEREPELVLKTLGPRSAA